MQIFETVRTELKALAEPQYRDFSASLLPGVPDILGVRLPNLRKISARLARSDWQAWLDGFSAAAVPFFEETMLAGMTIAAAPLSLPERFAQIRWFVPLIQNWSVCDSFCASLKEASQFPAEYWAFLQEYFSSKEEFPLRFALVMAGGHFLTPEYLPLVLDEIDSFCSPAYYASMAAAWTLSLCFIRFPQETLPRLASSRLDNITFNRALQ